MHDTKNTNIVQYYNQHQCSFQLTKSTRLHCLCVCACSPYLQFLFHVNSETERYMGEICMCSTVSARAWHDNFIFHSHAYKHRSLHTIGSIGVYRFLFVVCCCGSTLVIIKPVGEICSFFVRCLLLELTLQQSCICVIFK